MSCLLAKFASISFANKSNTHIRRKTSPKIWSDKNDTFAKKMLKTYNFYMFFRHQNTLFQKISEKNLRIYISKREILLSKWVNRFFSCIYQLSFVSMKNKQLLRELHELKIPMWVGIPSPLQDVELRGKNSVSLDTNASQTTDTMDVKRMSYRQS